MKAVGYKIDSTEEGSVSGLVEKIARLDRRIDELERDVDTALDVRGKTLLRYYAIMYGIKPGAVISMIPKGKTKPEVLKIIGVVPPTAVGTKNVLLGPTEIITVKKTKSGTWGKKEFSWYWAEEGDYQVIDEK